MGTDYLFQGFLFLFLCVGYFGAGVGCPLLSKSGKGEHSHQHSSSHNRYQTHPPSCPSRALSHFNFCLYLSCPEPAQCLWGFLLAVGGFAWLPCSASGWARLVCVFPLAGLWGLLPAASPGCCVVVPRQGTAGLWLVLKWPNVVILAQAISWPSQSNVF